MRLITTMLASAGMMLTAAATAVAQPLRLLQDPPVQVQVTTTESSTVWYAQPVWLAIGGVVVLLVIVLAVMAARGRDNASTTTVVR